MNKKCLKCGAYQPSENKCRIVHWMSIDELNIEGCCGFYEVNKLPRETLLSRVRKLFKTNKTTR